jgi:hypothetical protein
MILSKKHSTKASDSLRNDGIEFRTIADALDYLLRTDYTRMRKSRFTPKKLRGEYGNEYNVWFPKLAVDGHAATKTGWINNLLSNGLYIEEYNEDNDITISTREKFGDDVPKRITFIYSKNPRTGKYDYRFSGVYAFEKWKKGKTLKRIWKRVEDSFPRCK